MELKASCFSGSYILGFLTALYENVVPNHLFFAILGCVFIELT